MHCQSQNSFRLWWAALAVAFTLSSVPASRGQTYDAVSDFTGTNPSGAWSYLWSKSVGGMLSPLTFTAVFNSQVSGFYNDLGEPSNVFALRNFGPGTSSINGGGTVIPTNLLALDPESDAVDVRWTAPATGDYAIGGTFQMITSNVQPLEVQVLQNLAAPDQSTLLSDDLTGPVYGQQIPFNFNEQVNAGQTVDFVVNSTGGYQALLTGFSATIVAVPEPASLSLVALAAPALLGRRRIRA